MSMEVTRVVVEEEKLDEGDMSPPKLKKMVRLYEYSCTFCLKRFYSAQAMGGHQNAHRLERIRHKKLFIKDPIGYRKTLKNYINVAGTSTIKHRPLDNRRATRELIMVKHQKNQKKQLSTGERSSSRVVKIKPKPAVSVADNASYRNNCFCDNHPTFYPVQLNFLPPKELSLAEKVGIHAADEDAQFMACNEVEKENLDLTLKL